MKLTATDDPLRRQLAETFRDRAAFDANQARTRASVWYAATVPITRDYTVIED